MKRLRILFHGFRHGHIDGLYRRVAGADYAEVVGCIEADARARARAQSVLGAEFSSATYEEWLCSDMDAVAVGDAYGDRGGVIIKALEAGKHVIADKPFCTDLTELARIRELCEEKGLILTCMLDLRYLPQVQRARQILQDGMLGAVRNVAFNGQHCMDYAHRPAWYFEKGKHGGTVNDLAIHGIDLVRMLTGMEFSRIDAARTWNAYATRHPDFKDAAIFMAQLENGAGVLADVSYSAPSQAFSMPTYWEFRIWCERGLMTFCYTDGSVTLYGEGAAAPVVLAGIPCERDWLSDFAADIETGHIAATRDLMCSAETALRIQKMAEKGET